ncbi:hypothetical protein CLAIMM_05240 [Cladophialophora immunda]|nr:hypothetical protein CLAIMM_05240 [Cladophialophora immunda]
MGTLTAHCMWQSPSAFVYNLLLRTFTWDSVIVCQMISSLVGKKGADLIRAVPSALSMIAGVATPYHLLSQCLNLSHYGTVNPISQSGPLPSGLRPPQTPFLPVLPTPGIGGAIESPPNPPQFGLD